MGKTNDYGFCLRIPNINVTVFYFVLFMGSITQWVLPKILGFVQEFLTLMLVGIFVAISTYFIFINFVVSYFHGFCLRIPYIDVSGLICCDFCFFSINHTYPSANTKLNIRII